MNAISRKRLLVLPARGTDAAGSSEALRPRFLLTSMAAKRRLCLSSPCCRPPSMR